MTTFKQRLAWYKLAFEKMDSRCLPFICNTLSIYDAEFDRLRTSVGVATEVLLPELWDKRTIEEPDVLGGKTGVWFDGGNWEGDKQIRKAVLSKIIYEMEEKQMQRRYGLFLAICFIISVTAIIVLSR